MIAGIIQDQRYFDEEVAPHVDGQLVRYVGPIGPEDRSTILGGAAALLHLISFEEPFGFSVVEAMACGTPVVAFRRGAMPELIEHGVTGFLVDDGEQAITAVALAGTLDRLQIRQRAIVRFGRDRMVEEYLAAYRLFARPRPRIVTSEGDRCLGARGGRSSLPDGSGPRGTSARRHWS